MWIKVMGERCWVYKHRETGEVRFTPPPGQAFEVVHSERRRLNLTSGRIQLPQLLDATTQIIEELGRTPLFFDTPDELVHTFYSYGNGVVVDCKQLTLALLHGLSPQVVRDRARTKIVDAMRCGYTLVLALSNSAPSFMSKLCHSFYFPVEVFDCEAIRDPDVYEKLFREPDKDRHGNCVIRADFRVVVLSRFNRRNYESYLGTETPLDKLFPLQVYADS